MLDGSNGFVILAVKWFDLVTCTKAIKNFQPIQVVFIFKFLQVHITSFTSTSESHLNCSKYI